MFQWLKLSFTMFLLTALNVSQAGTEITDLVCEYQTNPIGIDITNPRLSWKIVSDKQNVLQTAYEIRVANSPANLSKKNKQI
jgi:alpha-L-rhamnosidase